MLIQLQGSWSSSFQSWPLPVEAGTVRGSRLFKVRAWKRSLGSTPPRNDTMSKNVQELKFDNDPHIFDQAPWWFERFSSRLLLLRLYNACMKPRGFRTRHCFRYVFLRCYIAWGCRSSLQISGQPDSKRSQHAGLE